MRVALVRTGVASDSDGGALAKMLPPFRAGMGGVVGSGRQWLSWIHIDDLVGIYLLALDGADGTAQRLRAESGNERRFYEGARRGAATPDDAAGSDVCAARAARRGRGDAAAGQRVLPKRTQELGYRFRFPDLKDALANLL